MVRLVWLHILLGLFLIVAPFLFGYSGNVAATWVSILSGIVSALVAAIVLATTRRRVAI